MTNHSRIRLAIFAVLALVLAACGSDSELASGDSSCFADPGLEATSADGDFSGTEITLATHDSFALSEGTLAAFEAESGITVNQVAVGDAGQLVSQSVLTKDNPTADVLFGIDNTFLCRGLEEGLFTPYASPGLDVVVEGIALDPHNRVTPIDYSDVCVNYWTDAIPGDPPTSLDDLIDPENAGLFVTQNPETSSPGFSFLLATISRYGEDGWEDYWQSLVDNEALVVAGWSDAYEIEFTGAGGDRPIVTSYASSPPFELLFAEEELDAPPSGVLFDSCFRQIEFAGILAGTENPGAAAQLIDFMLSNTYQEDLPFSQFVYPASTEAAVDAAFLEFGSLSDDPLTVDPAVIEANRDDWTERWNAIITG